jgi:hypothetical protein
MKLWRIALGAWLVLYGVFALTNVRVEAGNLIMGALAVVAAALLFWDR